MTSEEVVLPATAPPAHPRWAVVLVMLAVTGVALGAGFLLKNPCLSHAWDGYQYRHNCYSDLMPLYGDRGEYFGPGDFANHAAAYRDANFEYPALTGLFVTAVNAPVPANDMRGFFVANALALSVFGLAGAAALALVARNRWRLIFYALAPAMVLYAFHNWDLLAVGLATVGLAAFVKDRDGWAGLALGLAASAKLYPAFFVLVLMLARWKDHRLPWRLLAGAAVGFLVPNLIVVGYAGWSGWWFPWHFQSTRLPNYETSWWFIMRHGSAGHASGFWDPAKYGRFAQMLSTVLFLAGLGILLWREVRRDRFRPMVVCFGTLLLFLLTAKVFSPQYAIWALPFFVLTGISWQGFAAFAVADGLVLAAIWAYFLTPSGSAGSESWRLNLLEAAVMFRYAVLAFLLWQSRRADDLTIADVGADARVAGPAIEVAPGTT